MSKTKRLLLILLGLAIISLLLLVFDGKNDQQDFSKTIFTITDTAAISHIEISSGLEIIDLESKNGRWLLNQTYQADPAMIDLVKTIVSQVAVKRPVSPIDFEAVKQDLIRNGRKVSMKASERNFSFYTGGSAPTKTSYFGTGDLAEIYLVEIPGYTNYIAGIFELNFSQWRDRLLFNTHWRSLQSLTIDYRNSKMSDLNIQFEDRFLVVNGLQKLDTAKLMNYLQPLEYFQINDFLTKGRYPKYDSLIETVPLAYLQLEDIDQAKSKELTIYPLMPGEQFYLLTDMGNDMMVVDRKRIENLLRQKRFFEAK